MEKTSIDSHTVIGYMTTIAKNVNALATHIGPEISGLLWQAGNLPLEQQKELNEELLAIMSLTVELRSKVNDLLGSELITGKQV